MSVDVLMVEDNSGDVRLMREALRSSKRTINLHVAFDGMEALEFLRQQKKYARAPRPALILLDLHLPKLNGREVLAQIRQDTQLKTIPTIVLTTSTAQSDIDLAYALKANCYISKPSFPDALDRIVDSINDFWLTTAKLPIEARSI